MDFDDYNVWDPFRGSLYCTNYKRSLQTSSIFLDRAVSESSKCKMQLFCKNSRQILTLLKVVLLQLAHSLPVNYTSQLLRNLIAWCLLCKYQDSISVCMGLIHHCHNTFNGQSTYSPSLTLQTNMQQVCVSEAKLLIC